MGSGVGVSTTTSYYFFQRCTDLRIDARSQLTICGNFIIYLFLLAFEPAGMDAALSSLESFHESLQKLNEMTDANSRLLIRPVALRIDSFFIFASQMSRRIHP